MRMKKLSKQLMAGVLSLAMVLTAGALPGQTASAAGKKMKLTSKSVTVKVGKSKTVKVKNAPKKAKLSWSSKNTKIAKVTKKGKITGVKKGSTKVICKVTYKQNNKKKTNKLTVKVTVKKASAGSTASPSATPASPGAVAPGQPTAVPGQPTAVPGQPTAVPTEAPADPTTPGLQYPLVKINDTSNIGEPREVSIVGGTSEKMTIKDNGSVRKDLSTLWLIENEMGQGINLGNTMEATKALGEIDSTTEATAFEQAWGAPITTQEYIDAVHTYGFNTLRIPVAWTSMVSKDGNYTINEKMLGRVEEIVNYALNNGMYVIVNDHWDYGWWGAFGSADPVVAENAMKRYTAYWTQICDRFKDYSDHLILESANEELGSRLNDPMNEDGYSVDGGTRGVLSTQECYDMTNKINQTFVDIVRNSGGNNAYRHLLIAGFNTNIESTVDEGKDRFKMPKDTDENGNTKLSLSVHYYDPWAYCGDDALAGDHEYSEGDKQHHVQQFDMLKKFTDQGYGVIVGEFGVCNPRQEKVAEWLRDVMEVASTRGCLPVLWDTPGTYFDRKGCKMTYKNIAELYNQVTGANGSTDIKAVTGAPSIDAEFVDVAAGTSPVWSWEGQWAKNDGKNIGLDGSQVSSTDESKFIQTETCTDVEKITFNNWGYQTFLNLDWNSITKPCIRVTFEEDTMDKVGNIQLGSVTEANGSATDTQIYEHALWTGKGVVLSESMVTSLQEKGWLSLTFGNAPRVTGIYVYDLAQ